MQIQPPNQAAQLLSLSSNTSVKFEQLIIWCSLGATPQPCICRFNTCLMC